MSDYDKFATKAIITYQIKCKLCGKMVESVTDTDVVVELVYHLHEEHKGTNVF